MEFKQRPHRPNQPKSPQPQTTERPRDTGPKANESVKTVEIKLSLPKMPKRLRKLPSRQDVSKFATKIYKKLPKKKLLIIACIIIALVILYFAALSLMHQYAIYKNGGMSADDSKILEVPNYVTILPDGKTIGQLGGWKRVSPPKSNPVFAYADKISGTPVSVSQQPIPESFQDSVTDSVEQLALEFNATDKVKADDITLYIGTSAKGPQSVIFTKNDLLILIKSQAKITNEQWSNYARSLQ